MAQECGFFNAQLEGEEYDRVYLAEQFAAYFASFIGNGVFGSSMQQLEVAAQDSPDMSVKVLSGQAWINGWWYRNTTGYTLPVSVADGVLSRIDIVVLRWGNTERDMWLQVIEGTPSVNPVKPDIRRDADYYDLQLCEISIPAGSIRITQAQITDTRLDTSVCGLVTGVVDQIDTTDLYNQFEAYFAEWKANQQADYESWTVAKKAAYDAWVANTQRLYDAWVGDKQDEYTTWTANKMAEYVTWVANMQSEYSTWVEEQMQEYTDWITNQETTFDEWADEHREEYDAWIAARQLEFQSWYNTHTTNWANDFEAWFETIRGQLDGDIAGSLQNQINDLSVVVANFEGMLIDGLVYFPASTDDADAIVTNEGAYLLFTQRFNVLSFNGRSGAVIPQSGDYTASMVGLGDVDNTSDLNKPISTATQAALDGKADTSSLTDGSVTKIGTGNVGSATQPVYINGGVPTAIDAVDTVAEASRVKSSTELDALCALVVADHKTRFFRIQGTTGMDNTLAGLITYKNVLYPYGWGIISDTYSGGSSNYDIVITYFAGPSYPDNSQSRIFIWKQATSGTFRQNNVLITNKDTDIQTGTPTNVHSNLTQGGSLISYVNKSGNVVDFCFYATVATAGTIASQTTICRLPYKPVSQSFGNISYGTFGSGYSDGHYYLTRDYAELKLAAPITFSVNQEIYVRGTYLTND